MTYLDLTEYMDLKKTRISITELNQTTAYLTILLHNSNYNNVYLTPNNSSLEELLRYVFEDENQNNNYFIKKISNIRLKDTNPKASDIIISTNKESPLESALNIAIEENEKDISIYYKFKRDNWIKYVSFKNYAPASYLTIAGISMKLINNYLYAKHVSKLKEKRFFKKLKENSDISIEFNKTKHRNRSFRIYGVGGTGNFTTVALAISDVKSITIIDGDTLEDRNVGKQAFLVSDVGKPKVEIMKKTIEKLKKLKLVRKDLKINYLNRMIENIETINEDIVISCVDNLLARYFISKSCINSKKIYGDCAADEIQAVASITDEIKFQVPPKDRVIEEVFNKNGKNKKTIEWIVSKLNIPFEELKLKYDITEEDLINNAESTSQTIERDGHACNIVYINTPDTNQMHTITPIEDLMIAGGMISELAMSFDRGNTSFNCYPDLKITYFTD